MPNKIQVAFLFLLLLFNERSVCFQVQNSKTFKDVVEKTTGKSISNPSFQPLTILSDKSFSRQIPCESSKQEQIARPLSKSIKTHSILSPRRDQVPRKRIGLDDMPTEYWCVKSLNRRALATPTSIFFWHFISFFELHIFFLHFISRFDNRIHTFGNVGFFGGLHAACAPFATWLIDEKAYGQINARALIAKELYKVTINFLFDHLCFIPEYHMHYSN